MEPRQEGWALFGFESVVIHGSPATKQYMNEVEGPGRTWAIALSGAYCEIAHSRPGTMLVLADAIARLFIDQELVHSNGPWRTGPEPLASPLPVPFAHPSGCRRPVHGAQDTCESTRTGLAATVKEARPRDERESSVLFDGNRFDDRSSDPGGSDAVQRDRSNNATHRASVSSRNRWQCLGNGEMVEAFIQRGRRDKSLRGDLAPDRQIVCHHGNEVHRRGT
jgi:hypothetical protein